MTTEMIRLEKLYAKGKKVWEYANEWNSHPAADYKNAENIFGHDDGDKVYIIYGFESNIFVVVHDADSGELLSKNLITDNLYDYFHAIVNDKKIYIAQNISKTQSSVLVFDLLENELIDDYVTSDLFTTQRYEKGLTFLSVDDDGGIYVAYSNIMRKLVLNDEGISAVWEVETLNKAGYILLDNNDLYVLSNTETATCYKYSVVDGDLITSLAMDINPYSGGYIISRFINFMDSRKDINIFIDFSPVKPGYSQFYILKLVKISKKSFSSEETLIFTSSFEIGTSGFSFNDEYYLTKPEYRVKPANGKPTMNPGGLMKTNGNCTNVLVPTTPFYNHLDPEKPVTDGTKNIYTLFFLGLREHAYYVNKDDGILRKRKLAKGGIFLNGNLN